jgi:hypothetical protein
MMNDHTLPYHCSGHRHYHGPHAYVTDKAADDGLSSGAGEGEGEKSSVGIEVVAGDTLNVSRSSIDAANGG